MGGIYTGPFSRCKAARWAALGRGEGAAGLRPAALPAVEVEDDWSAPSARVIDARERLTAAAPALLSRCVLDPIEKPAAPGGLFDLWGWNGARRVGAERRAGVKPVASSAFPVTQSLTDW